jgi:hypothetical protein
VHRQRPELAKCLMDVAYSHGACMLAPQPQCNNAGL